MSEQEALDLMMKEGFQQEGEAVAKWKRARLSSTQHKAIRGADATTSLGAGFGTVVGWTVVLGAVGVVRFMRAELP